MPTTFVTALLDLRLPLKRETYKSELIQHFKKIANLKLSIHLFLSKTFEEEYKEIIGERNNIHITYIEIEQLDTYTLVEDIGLELPSERCEKKDTYTFMILMNAKIELIHKSIQQNYFHSTSFAWIDFGIGHVFTKWDWVSEQLQKIANINYNSEYCMFPGCWGLGKEIHKSFVKINWRFCGGFFIGDIKSLEKFYSLFIRHFRTICLEEKILTWEVNIWHILEYKYGWNPIWFCGDHNESIIDIPSWILGE